MGGREAHACSVLFAGMLAERLFGTRGGPFIGLSVAARVRFLDRKFIG